MSDDNSLRSVQSAFFLLIVVLGGILSIPFRLYIYMHFVELYRAYYCLDDTFQHADTLEIKPLLTRKSPPALSGRLALTRPFPG